MKTVEIKSLGLSSVFKVTAILLLIPSVLFFLVALGTCTFALLTDQRQLLAMGLPHLILSISIIPFYGVLFMLIAAVYNTLAPRVGGLVVRIEESAK